MRTRSRRLPRATIVAAAACVVAMVAWCVPASGTSTALRGQTVRAVVAKSASTAPITVSAVVADAVDPFYLTMECGAKAAAKLYNVKLTWQGSPSIDVAPELAILQGVELRHSEGMILAPFSPTVFIEPVKALMAKGVPVVTVDGQLSQPVELENVRTGNMAAGALGADYLGNRLKGTGIVSVVDSTPSLPGDVARVNGFRDEMKAKFPHITVLSTQYAESDAGKAATITSALLEAHPNLSGLYVSDASDAQGAAAAVVAAGDLGKVPIVGFDVTPVEVTDLEDGVFTALIAQEPYQEGYRAVEVLARYIRHQITKAQIPYLYYTAATMVTKANVKNPAMKKVLYTTTCS
ncbi:MAG: substrate-binding domain-containing protein [Acidimicrobiales bacterium]